MWELVEVCKKIEPERIIICLPLNRRGDFVDDDKYRNFRKASMSFLPYPLPDAPVEKAQFVFFSKDWVPQFFAPGLTRNDEVDNKVQMLLSKEFALAATPLFMRHPTTYVFVTIIVMTIYGFLK